MTELYVNGRKIEFTDISIKQYMNKISSASITTPFNDEIKYFDYVEIKEGQFTLFRGYIVQLEHESKVNQRSSKFTAYDPLIKLKNTSFIGGYSGYLQDLLNQLCDEINIINAVSVNAKVNLRYENETNKYQLLKDAFHFAKTSFYYDSQTNELRDISTTYSDVITHLVFSWNKRVRMLQTINDKIVNVVKVTNQR
jgi:hypothetical protein